MRTKETKPNDFNIYQKAAHLYASYSNPDDAAHEPFNYPVLGLCSEAGEVADKFKKLWRDRHVRSFDELTDEDVEALKKELGDCMWYLSEIATKLGVRLSDVAGSNIKKLQSRKERNRIHGSGDNR